MAVMEDNNYSDLHLDINIVKDHNPYKSGGESLHADHQPLKDVTPKSHNSDFWKEPSADKIKQALTDAFHHCAKIGLITNNAELGVLLTGDSCIKELNKRYRGKDKPTNVLSFGMETEADFLPDHCEEPEDKLSLGDLILSWEIINKEAQEQGKTLENHVVHLLVHGFLHLLGHDHEEEKEANTMEAIECDILLRMGIDNPYE